MLVIFSSRSHSGTRKWVLHPFPLLMLKVDAGYSKCNGHILISKDFKECEPLRREVRFSGLLV